MSQWEQALARIWIHLSAGKALPSDEPSETLPVMKRQYAVVLL